MTAKHAIKRQLEVAQESSFATSPGSYLPVKTTQEGLGLPAWQDTFDDRNYAVGRARKTKKEHLTGGASLPIELEWVPFSAAANTDTGAVPSADGLDYLLISAFGAATSFAGRGAAASTGTALNLDAGADTYNAGDIVCPQGSGTNSGIAQVRMITDDDGSGPPPVHVVSRAWDDDLDGSEICFGYRVYGRAVDTGGTSIAAILADDDTAYTFTGGRLIPRTLTVESGKLCRLAGDLRFRDRAQSGSPTTLTSGTILGAGQIPAKGILSQVDWNGTAYSNVARVTINFNAVMEPLAALNATDGIGDFENLEFHPTIEVSFLAADTYRAAMAAETQGEFILKFGSGIYDSGNDIMPCGVFYAPRVQVMRDQPENTKRRRNTVTFEVIDYGQIDTSPSTIAPYWGLCRF